VESTERAIGNNPLFIYILRENEKCQVVFKKIGYLVICPILVYIPEENKKCSDFFRKIEGWVIR